MQKEVFLANKTINEVKIKGNSRPYFQGLKSEPLSFQVSFAFNGQYDSNLLQDVKRWLSPLYYSELKFSDNLDRIYYAMPVEDSQLIHNCLKEGYVQINFRCADSFAYSIVYETQIYNYSVNPFGTILEFVNNGDVEIKPILYITKVGAGDISIFNQTNGNLEFKFTGLNDQEELTVYNDEEIIESSTGLYRYDNFNDNYLNILRGTNNLNIVGTFTLKIKYQFKFL